MTKLEQLVARCKGAVHVTVNDHTTGYQTIEKYIESLIERGEEFDDADAVALRLCFEADAVWDVVAYPRNPIGSYRAFGPTLDYALDQLFECIPEPDAKT